MRKTGILCSLLGALALASCSPRDFLTRRLALDLISASDAFKTPQQYVVQTGIVSNTDYSTPESLALQHHGWTTASTTTCPAGLAPAPCWEILLTPSGVDTVRAIVSDEEAAKRSIAIPVARRELLSITGIAKQGNSADVDFTWTWVPLNEIGAALYSRDIHSKATVGFREYDDGWHVMEHAVRSGQSLDEALKNSEPAP
jgi:hypothetical protein